MGLPGPLELAAPPGTTVPWEAWSATCGVGRGHALLLANLDTWHSKRVRDIGYLRIFSPTKCSKHLGLLLLQHPRERANLRLNNARDL